MSTIEYAFFPLVFFMFGAGFWLGMKVAERKPRPLTDEQINAVMASCLNDWDWRAFARAIERAITGEPT